MPQNSPEDKRRFARRRARLVSVLDASSPDHHLAMPLDERDRTQVVDDDLRTALGAADVLFGGGSTAMDLGVAEPVEFAVMTKLILLPLAVVVAACSSSSGGAPNSLLDAAVDAPTATTDGGSLPPDAGSDAASSIASDAASTGACAALPSKATIEGAGCTGASGTFTEVTYDSTAGTYSEACDVTPYTSQADFDANEGMSTQAGTTITSHEDYVLKPGCASGSIDYETSGTPKTTILFIWTKVP